MDLNFYYSPLYLLDMGLQVWANMPCLCNAREQTEGFVHDRHVLYPVHRWFYQLTLRHSVSRDDILQVPIGLSKDCEFPKQQLHFHHFPRLQLRACVAHDWHLSDEWADLQTNSDNFLLTIEVLCVPLMAGVGWSVLLQFCPSLFNPNTCLLGLKVSLHCGSFTGSMVLDVNL